MPENDKGTKYTFIDGQFREGCENILFYYSVGSYTVLICLDMVIHTPDTKVLGFGPGARSIDMTSAL